MSDCFNDQLFRRQVNNAVDKVKLVLHETRSPQYVGDVPHQYHDKYKLAESLSNTSLCALMQCLQTMGVEPNDVLEPRGQQIQTKKHVLSFSFVETCAFDRESSRKVESASQVVTESEAFGKTTSKVETMVTEYVWKVTATWGLELQNENGEKVRIVAAHTASCEIVTSRKTMPTSRKSANCEVDLTPLLKHLFLVENAMPPTAPASSSPFSAHVVIDRDVEQCRTPRRNPLVDSLVLHHRKVREFIAKVTSVFVQPSGHDSSNKLLASARETIFMPTLAIMCPVTCDDISVKGTLVSGLAAVAAVAVESKEDTETKESVSVTLSRSETDMLLRRHLNTLTAALGSLDFACEGFLAEKRMDGLVTFAEVRILLLASHITNLMTAFEHAVDAIEAALRSQLVAAVGKELTTGDFEDFMRFHFAKVFHASYQPKPFCFAVRMPEHSPEGTLSIEASSASASSSSRSTNARTEPIFTLQREVDAPFNKAAARMHFPINASTQVTFTGPQMVHAYIAQQFADTPASTSSMSLVVRARQFSSFILVAGTVASATKFVPQHAIIVKNNDSVLLPLVLTRLPSAKTFRDAIESLSPEQQDFAKAVRGMQLASSTFALCIVQLKPHLERVLNLPEDSLTKEIELTQNLEELFIQYQIPTDLVKFDGDVVMDTTDVKLDAVKLAVDKLQTMLKMAKQKVEVAALQHQNTFGAAHPGAYAVQQGYGQSYGAKPAAAAAASFGSLGGFGTAPSTGSCFGSAPSSSYGFSNRESSGFGFGAPAAAAAPAAVAFSSNRCVAESSSLDDFFSSNSVTDSSLSSTDKSLTFGSDFTSSSASSATPSILPTSVVLRDWTQLPVQMDQACGKLHDAALRPTTVKIGDVWTRSRQENVLTKSVSSTLRAADQTTEMNQAFDLLDALSRSGTLPLQATLHILVAVTHQFEATLIDTVIQGNVNPIQVLERSALLVATALYDNTEPSALMR